MTDSISDHWGQDDLYQKITNALIETGISLDNVTSDDLSPVDHYHARGLASTIELAEQLPIQKGHALVDIGCGVGGPARYLAKHYQCKVTGIDITASFVDVANKLSALVGMQSSTEFTLGDGHHLPYRDNAFDGGLSQHVTMNVADRWQFLSEAYRVIKPGGYFALTEHGLGPEGHPVHPLPWSKSGENEFLKTPDETVKLLESVGFTDIQVTDTGSKYVAAYQKAIQLAQNGQAPKLGVHLLIGKDALLITQNAARNIEEKRTHPIQIICKKPIAHATA